MNKKEELAQALEAEHKRLPKYNMMGDSNNLEDYPDAINYLRTGEIPENYQNSDLLMGVIDDFDMMYNDYCR